LFDIVDFVYYNAIMFTYINKKILSTQNILRFWGGGIMPSIRGLKYG